VENKQDEFKKQYFSFIDISKINCIVNTADLCVEAARSSIHEQKHLNNNRDARRIKKDFEDDNRK
jgi:hypothetical protein